MDRIEKITIENYKSIAHCSIDNCNEINLLVGPPNSGKSNIIENLSVFNYRNSFKFEIQNKKNKSHSILDLNSTKNNYLKKILRFESTYDLFFSNTNPKNNCKIELTNNSNLSFNLIYNEKLNSNFNDKLYKERFELSNNQSLDIEYSYLVTTFYNIFFYKFKHQDNKTYLDQKRLLDPYGENLGEVIYFNEELQKYIQSELQKVGMSLSIIKNDKTPKAQLTDKNGVSLLFDFYMLADTFQRIVFYKAAILSNKESILLFEEPEAHCYEPYMIDFVKDILYCGNDNQYFIVTHSDFILQEFLRDEENRQRTNIYMVKNEPNQGTKVKLINKENKDVYNYGMNVFFNFDSLWEETKN